MTNLKNNLSNLTIAIPKGFLHDSSYKYLSKLGINFDQENAMLRFEATSNQALKLLELGCT